MNRFILFGITIACFELGLAQFQNNYSQQRQDQQTRGSSVHCPEPNGKFVHPTHCDAYIECVDNVGSEKFCPDGLLFNPAASYLVYPCQYPIEVNCEGRSQLQPAQATPECPRSYGYYKLGDGTSCNNFLNCVGGRAFYFECPLGLAFNEETLHCDWPDQVPSCDAEAYLGFKCPPNYSDFKTYPSPYDCTRYIVCVNGKPRLQACRNGEGFSEEESDCVEIEKLPACLAQKGISVSPNKGFSKKK